VGTQAKLEKVDPLRRPTARRYRTVSPRRTRRDDRRPDGNVLAPDRNGYDSRTGGRARRDVWVSTSTGLHHHSTGAARDRATLAVHGRCGRLPSGCRTGHGGADRHADGRTLVGICSRAAAGRLTKKPATSPVRILTTTCAARTHEYSTCSMTQGQQARSVITALSSTSFVVDERDGKPEPGPTRAVHDRPGGAPTSARRVPGYDASAGG